tara:strand:+ start:1417 stop:1833 length:417 start_codon:yes stop_codon:yes gene_type:complete
MAIQSTTFTASGSFSLTDANGVTVFSYSPSFTSLSNVGSLVLSTGEHLAGTTASEIALPEHNDDRVYCFVKHVDTDHSVEVSPAAQEGTSKECADLKPGEFFFAPMELNSDGTGTSITVGNGDSAQKIQYLLCDAIDN